MCHYITMVLPDLASCEVAEPILRDLERTLEVLANRHVQSQLVEGQVYASATGQQDVRLRHISRLP